ncbi:response regulator transcription factor [Marininema halotolerans]|uniref:Two-component system, OmpR family, response regulator SaeR n=1 Tax=Marininema halotolerans TaxID=1155944 RepID=A0A1I6PPQ5_9BACL|nr:response regulator transcription factor [Marininema halotolerans]SFS42100.1 two-component system, OmpR family, response regulator SaeR [Marininema halotolerans]
MDDTILIVDDEPTILDVAKRYLEKENFKVLLASDGKEAFRLCQNHEISLIVTDIMMPEVDGYDFILQVLDMDKEIPFLFISAKTQEKDRLYSLTLGAEDFITKPFSPRELVLRIKNILRRINKNTSKVLNRGPLTIQYDKRAATLYGEPLDLKLKEFELLWVLALDMERVYSKSELYEKVWGADYYGDANTLSVHIHRLREKLERISAERPHPVIKTIWGLGYKMEVNEVEIT